MRETIGDQSWLGATDIGEIKLDATCRDDIPAVLIGLQAIYKDEETREELFRLLDEHILPGRRHDTGRPGMNRWRILVMGILKQGMGCDFDRLRRTVNSDVDVQAFLGHDAWYDRREYGLQTIRDNVGLLTPELLRKVNELIVATGHEIIGKKPGDALAGRCDSFVVETDVHHPTDVNLLRDSVRCLIREASRACDAGGVDGWRQREHLSRKFGNQFLCVHRARWWRSRPDQVRSYLETARQVADKAEATLEALRETDCPRAVLGGIERHLDHARRFADQVDRRVLKGETIPHEEKRFSIFEEHTRWISKGKAGTPVELGVPVCIVEDGNGFVLGREIMWEGGDTDVAVPLIKRCQAAFPGLRICSFDKGFHSQENRRRLDATLDLTVLPKKGKLSAAEQARERDPAFAEARRKHSGVESVINSLEHRGLDRVRLHGPDGFERAVDLSVLAQNIHRIGQILRERERRRMRLEREKMREERKRLERQRKRMQRERKRTQRERKPLHQFQPLRAA